GDDNPLKWTRLVVEGKSIENMNAIYAHWASDNAANAAWCADAGLAAEVCGTGACASAAALAEDDVAPTTCVPRVIAAIVRELPPRRPDATDPIEARFLATLRADRSDDDCRAVYADWLDEQSRRDEAALVRLQIELRVVREEDARADLEARERFLTYF